MRFAYLQTIAAFFRALWCDWIAAMSGGFSVPFAAFAVFAKTTTGQVIWTVMAVLAFGFAAFRLWHAQYATVLELKEKLRPKLKCSFDEKEPGCVRSNVTATITDQHGNRIGTAVVNYYRIRVETDGVGAVEKCTARLISISRDGAKVFAGENIALPFAHAKTDEQNIFEGCPEYLDFIVTLPASNEIAPGTRNFIVPNSVDFKNIFSVRGEYAFEVVFSAPNVKSITSKIGLTWDGSAATAKFWQVS